MFHAIAVTALAALAAAQSNEVQSSDGSINIETRNGETMRRNRVSLPLPKRRFSATCFSTFYLLRASRSHTESWSRLLSPDR